jgi:hypothetical protein
LLIQSKNDGPFNSIKILSSLVKRDGASHLHFVQRKAEDLSKRLNVEKWRLSHQGE